MLKRSLVLISTMAMMITGAISTRSKVNAESTNTKITWGDSNNNNAVDIADAVLIMSSLANPNKYNITPIGKIAGDVYDNGSGITNSDALTIQKFLINKISYLPESYLETHGTTTTTHAITSTRPKTTTTAAFTSTTTTRPTTTTTTSTSTTTTITTSTNWLPPRKESLVNPMGEQIPTETYEILTKTAPKLFGIKGSYKIVWSDVPITNAFVDPGTFACYKNGFSYGYPVQIKNGSDIQEIAPEVNKIQGRIYSKKILAYRPQVEADANEFNVNNYLNNEHSFKSTSGNFIMILDNIIIPEVDKKDYEYYYSELLSQNINSVFPFANWYLVCDNDFISYQFETNIEPGATAKYRIPNIELKNITRVEYEKLEKTATYFNMPGFRIQYNENGTPEKYSFVVSGIYSLGNKTEIGYQIIPGEDLPKVYNLMEYCLQLKNGDQNEANSEYQKLVSEPYWLWSIGEDGKTTIIHYEDYFEINVVMIPLDNNGHDDLKVYNF